MTLRPAGCNAALGVDGAAADDRADDPDPGLPAVIGSLAVPVEEVTVRQRVLARDVDQGQIRIEAFRNASLSPVDPEPPRDVRREQPRELGKRNLGGPARD